GNWVDRWAPASARPFLRLARADRPIGVWLLLWPCWWSVALAAIASGAPLPDVRLLMLFAIGALAMRAAGCAYNDIVDREFDAKVARTRSRPIPSGQISVREAVLFMLVLCLIGLLVLLQFNYQTIILGFASLGIVAVYPFMKRVTNWPQAILGLAFSWGALMGWCAVFGGLSPPPLYLYAAAVAWTIGYDTIYAHQDKEDDALLGLKSSALKLGAATRPVLAILYAVTIAGILAAGLSAGAGVIFVAILGVGALQLAWQVTTLDIDDAENCLTRFRSNRDFGAIIFLAMLADLITRLFERMI
ncbi:MAG: 4-hydroxybenzoate octaprenyltransferase, partial [Alphaproteobacteria bacterium]